MNLAQVPSLQQEFELADANLHVSERVALQMIPSSLVIPVP